MPMNWNTAKDIKIYSWSRIGPMIGGKERRQGQIIVIINSFKITCFTQQRISLNFNFMHNVQGNKVLFFRKIWKSRAFGMQVGKTMNTTVN